MGHFAHPLRRTRRRGLARAVRRWLLGQSARRSQTGRRPGYSTGRKKRAVQERVGPNPTDRGKAGVQKSGLVEGNGGPLSAAISGANTPDGKLLAVPLDAVVVEGPQPSQQEQHLGLDKG